MCTITELLLDVDGLKTYFYITRGIVKAVDGISFTINEKEAVGLVGESGCGKTATALSIMQLVPSPPGKIVAGRVLFKRKSLLELTDKEIRQVRGKEISMIFQDPMTFLNPVMKVGKQISETIELHENVSKEIAKEKTIRMLERVNIPSPDEAFHHYPSQLSGGMRQRVLIAMAISSNPSLLIADEPTTALDVTVQAQVLDLIKELMDDLGLSLLLITHNLGIVADICDRVYVMYAGKVVEYADVFTLYEDSKHPYTHGLLRSILRTDVFKKRIPTIGGTIPDLIDPPSGCRFHPRCRSRRAICRECEPPFVEMNHDHSVACWLYESKHSTPNRSIRSK